MLRKQQSDVERHPAVAGHHRPVRPVLPGSGAVRVHHLIHQGATPQRSAFLSAFFTLVGTHGLHVTFGLIWLVVLMIQIKQHGLIPGTTVASCACRCSGTFWTWSGSAFSLFVYLMGVL